MLRAVSSPAALPAAATLPCIKATESCSRSLRADVASTTGLLAADLACLGKEAAAMRGDLSALAGGLQQQQRELGLLSPRLGRLEALEAAGPRASLNLVTALESKVDALVAQEVRRCWQPRAWLGTQTHAVWAAHAPVGGAHCTIAWSTCCRHGTARAWRALCQHLLMTLWP